jgi:hypothetical protein
MKLPLRPCAALCALLALGLAAGAASGQAASATTATPPEAQAPTKADAAAAADVSRCRSVVMRHCRRARADAADPRDQDKGAPARWETVRSADPDADEILVEEARLGHPEVHEVFERYLRGGSAALLTRNAAGGARCTTIASTGATFCSHPGLETPGTGLPHTDFSDGAF